MRLFPMFLGLLLATTLSLIAQSVAPGQSPGMDLTLMKIFSGHQSFTAKSEIEVTGAGGLGDMSVPGEVSMLDGKMRTEVDMGRVKAKTMPAEMLAQMKESGMDRAVNILIPAEKKMHIIFPGMKAYVSMTLPDQAASAVTNKADIQKTEQGKDIIDGHPCLKSKLTITSGGQSQELTVWNASDLKEFPVQIETTEGSSKVVCKYRDIKFTKPDAKLFEPPANYKGYSDIQEMMMASMEKMMEKGNHNTQQVAPSH